MRPVKDDVKKNLLCDSFNIVRKLFDFAPSSSSNIDNYKRTLLNRHIPNYLPLAGQLRAMSLEFSMIRGDTTDSLSTSSSINCRIRGCTGAIVLVIHELQTLFQYKLLTMIIQVQYGAKIIHLTLTVFTLLCNLSTLVLTWVL